MERTLTTVSLFSGCGGFDYGAKCAGVDIVWANDIDPCATTAYHRVLRDVELYEGDIRDVKTFPQADILIGCYPCTGYSLAARRRWHDEEERNLFANDTNFLYREFMRALRQVRPKYIFVENVGGLKSAEQGWFFQAQIQGFKGNGYRTEYRVLNACDFGVPQSRKRLFIVAVRDDVDFEYSFPEPTHGPGRKYPYKVLRDAIEGMPPWPQGEYCDYPFHGHYLTRNRKRKWNEPSYTIVAHSHHIPLHPMGKPMKYIAKDIWETQGKSNRRLSWVECARVQGLPSTTIPSGSLDDKYRVIGNAVPPILGKILVKPIVDFECKAK